jgi:Spy/CpxP family protein refolding chaperone
MALRIALVLAAALACAQPLVATPLECEQSGGQKPDQGQRAANGAKDNDKRKDEHRGPWWKAAETRAELGISDKQSKDIDEVFQSTYPSLRAAKDELDKLDELVARTMKEGTADITTVKQQVGQAEQARAILATTRTMMLYRMHRILSPEQRAKLDAMFERREAERRKPKNSDGRH